jgi:hypothetical protein
VYKRLRYGFGVGGGIGLHSNGKGMHELALEDFRKKLVFPTMENIDERKPTKK